MNFDFLKDLPGLGQVYDNCDNAEKLAMKMPMQSIFTARKSAELLAKFIYLAAHNEQMETLSFAEILSDPAVRNYISDSETMRAFHYIRKNGNVAAHENGSQTVEDAIETLKALHLVSGKTARKLGLINNFPAFNAQIDVYPDAEYVDEKYIEEKAQKMFLDYLAALDEEQYIEWQDYDSYTYDIEGTVDMHERLEFKRNPKQPALIDYIQNYLLTLLRLSNERSPEKAKANEWPVTLDAKVVIGDETYSSKDADAFCEAIIKKLPKADGFIIDLNCDGNLTEYYGFYMIRKDAVWTGCGMFDTLEQYKRRNDFEYKLFIFYDCDRDNDSDRIECKKISDRKEINVFADCTDDIVDRSFDDEWWSWSLNLCVEFDFDKYHNELLQLQNVVRNYIPASEVQYCEDGWNLGYYAILCNGIQWSCRSLREVKDFLDKINLILMPIKDEIDATCDGIWVIRNRFAVATWKWTDEGFKIVGTEF